jgi:hypothetical protein
MFITSVVAALVQRVEQMITVVQTVRNEEMELL